MTVWRRLEKFLNIGRALLTPAGLSAGVRFWPCRGGTCSRPSWGRGLRDCAAIGGAGGTSLVSSCAHIGVFDPVSSPLSALMTPSAAALTEMKSCRSNCLSAGGCQAKGEQQLLYRMKHLYTSGRVRLDVLVFSACAPGKGSQSYFWCHLNTRNIKSFTGFCLRWQAEAPQVGAHLGRLCLSLSFHLNSFILSPPTQTF